MSIKLIFISLITEKASGQQMDSSLNKTPHRFQIV